MTRLLIRLIAGLAAFAAGFIVADTISERRVQHYRERARAAQVQATGFSIERDFDLQRRLVGDLADRARELHTRTRTGTTTMTANIRLNHPQQHLLKLLAASEDGIETTPEQIRAVTSLIEHGYALKIGPNTYAITPAGRLAHDPENVGRSAFPKAAE